MSRPLFLSNGHMLVGLNSFGLVHDFYYPYVGYENHLSSKKQMHKVGVWVDGNFSWLDDGSWNISIRYEDMALIGRIRATNDRLGVVLEFSDFVDHELNAFIRNVHVINKHQLRREIRLFFHQVFQISESTRGDSAVYLPDKHVILNYKGRRNFVVAGRKSDGGGFDQYGIGNYGIEGKEGTYKDAEDGQLSFNAVEHGRVDSAIGFNLNIPAHTSQRVSYWITVAQTRDDAIASHEAINRSSVHERHELTQSYWHNWVGVAEPRIMKLDPKYRAQVVNSLLIMKSHFDVRGAIIASGDSQMLNYARDYYGYFWPRDGAFVVWPLIRLGYTEEPKSFFEFCRDALTPGGYLMHKYLPNGSAGSTWHAALADGKEELPIQQDETAIVVFMLSEYLKYSGDTDFVERMFTSFVRPAVKYIVDFIDEPTGLPHQSFDLWEEKFLTTTYTTSTVYAALLAAASMAEEFNFPEDSVTWDRLARQIKIRSRDTFFNSERGYFYKGFTLNKDMMEYDSTIDTSSLYGAVLFGLYDMDDPYVIESQKTLENVLVDSAKIGGTPRYENDYYHRTDKDSLGNPWFVTSFWYAQYMIERGNHQRAEDILDWSLNFMLPTGVLPEQIDPVSGAFVSVAPLIWSQSEFVNTVFDLHSARDIPNEGS